MTCACTHARAHAHATTCTCACACACACARACARGMCMSAYACSPARAHPPARPPPARHTAHINPSPQAYIPAHCRACLRPAACVCAGPRLQHPGGVGWLKQQRHRHHQWHQHGGAACLGHRRPGACSGPDALGGATQVDNPRRRRGGRHRPFCKRSSRGHAQPFGHGRQRNVVISEAQVTSAVAAWDATLAALAALAACASYGSHWPWVCGGPAGRWAVRAKQWVR